MTKTLVIAVLLLAFAFAMAGFAAAEGGDDEF